MKKPRKPEPNTLIAASSNRTGTITVQATEDGLPVKITFDRSEYGYGAKALAAEIVRLTKRSTVVAKARRRELLAGEGHAPDTLDMLRLPTRQDAVDALDRMDDADTGPTSWLKKV